MKIYDSVMVVALRDRRFDNSAGAFQRPPQIGDVGAIVEAYADAFEVECSDPNNGETIWLEAMYPDEISPING